MKLQRFCNRNSLEECIPRTSIQFAKATTFLFIYLRISLLLLEILLWGFLLKYTQNYKYQCKDLCWIYTNILNVTNKPNKWWGLFEETFSIVILLKKIVNFVSWFIDTWNLATLGNSQPMKTWNIPNSTIWHAYKIFGLNKCGCLKIR